MNQKGLTKAIVISVILVLILITGITGIVLYRYMTEEIPVNLYVSNQSTLHDPAKIRVIVDGTVRFNRICYSDDQHNWTEVEFNVSRGSHTIKTVEEYNGSQKEESFRLSGELWIVVDFWSGNDPDTKTGRFTIGFHDQQVAFM